MDKLKLICYLNDAGKSKAAKTIAPALGVTEAVIKKAVKDVNSDKIYQISSGKGGGLTLKSLIEKEAGVYPIIEALLPDWIISAIFSDRGTTDKRLKATHKNKLSGKWSTPDFSVMCVHKFLYTPHKSVELVTVEVKHAETQFDVSCVYEALAHTRVSSYAILFFYTPPTFKVDNSVLVEIKSECARLGLGLVMTQYPCSKSDWTYVIPAKKHSPELQRLDSFIDEAFNEEEKRWLKTSL